MRAVIAQMFIPGEIVIPIGTLVKQMQKLKRNQQLLNLEKASVQHNLNTYIYSHIFHSLNHCVLFHLKDSFLFHHFF